jgi:hypothetical protein
MQLKISEIGPGRLLLLVGYTEYMQVNPGCRSVGYC